MYGQHHDIEITAACFDESEQLLVTGTRDGTLKIWNFNTGTCLRNMTIENQWYMFYYDLVLNYNTFVQSFAFLKFLIQ